MKKIFLLLTLALFIFSPSSADVGVSYYGTGHGGTASESCGSPAVGTYSERDWEDGGDFGSWTDTVSSGTIDDDESTTPASTCCFDVDWLEVEVTTGAFSRAHTYADSGSTDNEIWMRAFLYVVSEGLANTEYSHWFTAREDISEADDTNSTISFYDNSGTLELHIWSGDVDRDSYAITTGQAYCVEAHWDNDGTGDRWDWKITAESGGLYPVTPDKTGGAANDPGGSFERYAFGNYANYSPGRAIRFMTDNFDVSTTGWLGCDDN